MLKPQQKLAITQKVKDQKTNLLELMADEYNVIYRGFERDTKHFGLHLITRYQSRKGWKKLDRETRRYTYNEILKELERRTNNG